MLAFTGYYGFCMCGILCSDLCPDHTKDPELSVKHSCGNRALCTEKHGGQKPAPCRRSKSSTFLHIARALPAVLCVQLHADLTQAR